MTSDWLGGGLIVGLAAALWLIYLLPTWFRRNEYLATERNAVRLQQTLRILAETSEVPDVVRIEANAKSVVEQQRLLKKANANRASAARVAATTVTEPPRSTAKRQVNDLPPARLAAKKLRRSRAVASGILMLSIAAVVLGALQLAVTGAWVVLAVGVVSGTLCFTRLTRLAKLGRALRRHGVSGASGRGDAGSGSPVLDAADAADASRDTLDRARLYAETGVIDVDWSSAGTLTSAGTAATTAEADAARLDETVALPDSGWMPVPIPQPLYATHRRAIGVFAEPMPQPAAADDDLRRAAAEAERALRETQEQEQARAQARGIADPATPQTAARVQEPVAPPSRFSSMGVLDDVDASTLDVDRVLAKRRAG